MKKLSLLFILVLVSFLAPYKLYAGIFNLTVTVCNGTDCGDVTPPTAPTNLQVTAVTTNQVNLSWDASIDPGSPASGVSGYVIFRNGGAAATTTGTAYSDTGLSSGTSYTYTVEAFDQVLNYSSQSSSVSTTTIAVITNAPSPSNGSPTGVLPIGTTQTTISLSTDINATCKYDVSPGTPYASMVNLFSTTGGTSHSTVVSGLSNGTTHTYYVRCANTSNVPMTSDYIISFAVAAPVSSSGGGGGGGGGGSLPINPVNVIVRGIAYPGSKVGLLKDGQIAATTQAGPDAKFEIQLSGVGSGTYTFSVWAIDANGVRSTLYPFTVTLTQGATTVISGVFIPPTVSLDLSTVRRGDPLHVIGQSVPSSTVSVIFHSDNQIIDSVKADAQGLWNYTLDTLRLDYGDHTTQARSKNLDDISTLSSAISFKVGISNIAAKKQKAGVAGDFNGDDKVDLSDFSIMLYWYKRALTKTAPPVDLNHDGKVDLVDFSILAYNWTG